MSRLLFFILAIFILLQGCDRKHKKEPVAEKAQQDTLLRQFINKEFNMFLPYSTRLFDKQMEHQDHNNEIIIYPGPFKLKAYFFSENWHYSPFAIKVTTTTDSLITFFTFTDEIFYLNNIVADYTHDSITVRNHGENNNESLAQVNLEEHLNSLIKKLGYDVHESYIKNLLEVLFFVLLKAERICPGELSNVADILRSKSYKDAEAGKFVEELTEFARSRPNEFELRMKATVGTGGFWKLSIEKNDEGYYVKVKFIGDMIFGTVYL